MVLSTVGAYVGMDVGIDVGKAVGKDVGLLEGGSDSNMGIAGTTSVGLMALTLILLFPWGLKREMFSSRKMSYL